MKVGAGGSSDDQDVNDRADWVRSVVWADPVDGTVLVADGELCSSSRKTRVGLGAWLSQGNICVSFFGSGLVSGTW